MPHYFDTIIPTFTHYHNTRQYTLQQHRTIHSFPDQNCIHAMIAMINKHRIIKLNVTTSQSYSSFVYFVKHDILGGYELRFSVDNCYVCSSGYMEAMWYDSVALALLFIFSLFFV